MVMFLISLFVLLLFQPCKGGIPMVGTIPRGFQGAEMDWADNNGLFLISNSSNFGFGFQPTKDDTLFLLAIVHIASNRLVWTANREKPVKSSDEFVFDSHGNVSLQRGGEVIWSPKFGSGMAAAIHLLDSGNLVMVTDGLTWESFAHPFDNISSNQVFIEGMNLSTNLGVDDVITSAGIYRAAYDTRVDDNGLFLVSNASTFGFGLQPTKGGSLFLLVITHIDSNRQVWTANRGNPVESSDQFTFDLSGDVKLLSGEEVIWSPDTNGKVVSSIHLLDSGNLVMRGDDNSSVWESFRHPTDTLLPNQVFSEGMSLSSNPGVDNFSYFLHFKSGDLQLFVDFKTPQPYWSLAEDYEGAQITRAIIDEYAWKFYDDNVLHFSFTFSSDASVNSTWMAVLGSNGSIDFLSLERGNASSTKIPSDSCDTPDHCGAYYSCSNNACQCPTGLLYPNCNPGIVNPCGSASNASTEMRYAGDDLSYFALDYVSPTSTTNLSGCKASCIGNCSCLAMFFNNESGNCYMFDDVGSFKLDNTSKYAAFVKVLGGGMLLATRNKHPYLVIIIASVVVPVLIILSMVYGGYRYCMKKKEIKMGNEEHPYEGSDEENLFQSLSGLPVRYTYRDLETATNSFAVKLGQGGFGSVYQGALQDGTRIAVKQLEGVGQGKKEFKAEVRIIGTIHHVHLVRLRGFCTEGSHRLLAYEFMAKGSLDKWIFKNSTDEFVLDWNTRFNIAVGTAKGLAYLHEECDVKIIHCDIKPENVLLDDHFQAKVSDFGLAKLMTREQSHVSTPLSGTRGYLAPERIKRLAISEKSDVYSYGMVLLEIIGGRKNYDLKQSSEKFNFPSFVFKKMEDGNLGEVLDSSLEYNPDDESVCRAIKVALWCIQEDMDLRPSMTKVVQMLEGLSPVPHPPTSSLAGSSFYDKISNTYQSAVSLSGPR